MSEWQVLGKPNDDVNVKNKKYSSVQFKQYCLNKYLGHTRVLPKRTDAQKMVEEDEDVGRSDNIKLVCY